MNQRYTRIVNAKSIQKKKNHIYIKRHCVSVTIIKTKILKNEYIGMLHM